VRATTLCFALALCSSAWAQNQGFLASNFSREGEEFRKNCSSFKSLFSCGQLLVTGTPLRITAGNIAPGNGMAFGPAFVFDKNYTSWRMNFNADAVVSTNQSWRTGVYVKLARTPTKPPEPIVLTRRPPRPIQASPPAPAPEINLYVQATSLNHLGYYGIGNSTSRNDLALFGMREEIIGANGIFPFGNSGLALFGELNGRFVALRNESTATVPSITQQAIQFPALSPPGLASQPGFLQAGEGIRFSRDFASHFDLDYSAVLQEYFAPSDSTYSFRRLNLDFTHVIWLYGRRSRASTAQTYGPDGSPAALSNHNYVRDRNGSVTLDVLLSESYFGSGHAVPFYFQPTLGGSDINGEQLLPSYADYRFRAPNLLLFHGAFEHSIWGPIGLQFLAHFGRVATTPSDLGFDHFHHSYAAGVTIRAGNFPVVSLLFAWGGSEGTHNIAYVNPSLLGGTGRPSLF
jgi:hypothetical protein